MSDAASVSKMSASVPHTWIFSCKWLMERWQSGRMRRFAKPLYGLNRTGGSNPPLSAMFHRGILGHAHN